MESEGEDKKWMWQSRQGWNWPALVGHGNFCPPCSRHHRGLRAAEIPEAVQQPDLPWSWLLTLASKLVPLLNILSQVVCTRIVSQVWLL